MTHYANFGIKILLRNTPVKYVFRLGQSINFFSFISNARRTDIVRSFLSLFNSLSRVIANKYYNQLKTTIFTRGGERYL